MTDRDWIIYCGIIVATLIAVAIDEIIAARRGRK
jgi:hypothetical protein